MNIRTLTIAGIILLTPSAAVFAAPLTILDYSACSHYLGLVSCNQQTEVCATNPNTGNPGCFPKSQVTNYVNYTSTYPDQATCNQQSNCPYACTENKLATSPTFFCSQSPVNNTPNPVAQPSGGSSIGQTGIGGTTGGSIGQTAQPGQTVTLINPLGNNTCSANGTCLSSFISNIMKFVVQIGSVIVILMLVFVGYKFVVAQGSDSKLTEAKQMLLWTVVGALILLGAQAIALGIQSTVSAIGG